MLEKLKKSCFSCDSGDAAYLADKKTRVGLFDHVSRQKTP